MRARVTRSFSVLTIAIVLCVCPHVIFGCGPFFTVAIFTFFPHPDFPLEIFAHGELGILQPTYARSYLFVAYRNLSGQEFTAGEEKVLASFWQNRMQLRWREESPDLRIWNQARQQVKGTGPGSQAGTYKHSGDYSWYLNCTDDAFRIAAQTLNERIRQFGATSREVKEWLQAQDQVFHNCVWPEPSIPPPAQSDLHPLIRADRDYQIAAAYFYSAKFEKAEALFRQIAKDASSPWSKVAPYLVARALIRRGTLGGDSAAFAKARIELEAVQRDRKLVDIHPPARRLLKLVQYRTDPVGRFRELTRALRSKGTSRDLKEDLADYTFLLDRYESGELKDLQERVKADEMTDWIFTFKTEGSAALGHSLQRWTETHSLPWLVAALGKVDAGHPLAKQLLAAADSIERTSPAFASVRFHALRLMVEMGQEEEARTKLDELLSSGATKFPPSSVNLLLALRTKLARDLNEFLKYGQRKPVLISNDDNGLEIPSGRSRYPEIKDSRVFFDADVAKVLSERMPLSLLNEAVKNEDLAPHLRLELAAASWVRSVLLGEENTAVELAAQLRKLSGDLAPYWDRYLAEGGSEERKAAAIFTILKFPGLRPYIGGGLDRSTPLGRIDNLRENWWCAFKEPDEKHDDRFFDHYSRRTAFSQPLKIFYPKTDVQSPAFLTSAEREGAAREWKKLKSLDTAPNYLCAAVIGWAEGKPKDPRVPEALHLAVKSTRYGCTDSKTSQFSVTAFRLLHRRYAQSMWAKMTPLWY